MINGTSLLKDDFLLILLINSFNINQLFNILKYLYLAFIVIPSSTFSQVEDIYWFSEQEGLPTTVINSIEQDEKGNILLGTYLGLIIYDGEHFETKSLKHGLPTTSIGSIVKDPFNSIWIKSFSNKLSIYNDSQFEKITSYNDYIPNKIGYNIYFINKNEIIVDYVLPFYSVKHKKVNGKWHLIKNNTANNFSKEQRIPLRNPNNLNEICAYFDYTKFQDKKGAFFEFTNGKKYNYQLKNYIGYFAKRSINQNEFFSFDKHLIKYDKTGVIAERVFNDEIINIFKGNDQTIWVSFRNGGIQQLTDKALIPIDSVIATNQIIHHLLEDLEGGLWLAAEKGLGYIAPLNYKRYLLQDYFTSSINSTFVINDTMFIGHSNGDIGYFLPQKNQKEILIFSHPKISDRNCYVSNFIEDYEGNILVSNAETGIYKVNRKTLQVDQIYQSEASELNKKDGTIYCALWKTGFLKITNNKITITKFSDVTDEKLVAEAIYLDNKNRLFIGTQSGLYLYSNSKLISYKHRSLFSDRIVSMDAYGKDTVLISTCGSGMAFCTSKDTLILDKENGLISNCPSPSTRTVNGDFWIVGIEGVSRISILTSELKKFNVKNIYGSELKNHANFDVECLKNDVYLIGKRVMFNLTPLFANRKTPPLYIKSIHIDSNSYTTTNIKRVFSSSNIIEISLQQNNFIKNSHTYYYYRLLGFDTTWIRTKSNIIKYNSLTIGEYTLQAYASPSYSFISSKIIDIKINIIPNWWQTSWFRILTIIIVMLLLFFFIKRLVTNRINKLKREADLKQKMAYLEAKVLRANMNPHFVFNSLNSIKNFISKNQSEEANFYLGKFSKLMRDVLENSQQEYITLAEEVDMITNYIELEKMRSSNSFSYEIKIDKDLNINQLKLSGMLIQPYIENSIVHGLNLLDDRKGLLKIAFLKNNDKTLRCLIEDNGVGRKYAMEVKLKKEKYHKSLGLSITQERINIIKSTNSSDANVSIIDLYNKKNDPCGTKVEILIPILNKH